MDNCVPQKISTEVLEKPSIERQINVSVVSVTGLSWMDSIIAFLSDSVLLSKAKEAKKIQRILTRF